ncbi:AMP-binding protein [Ruegeria pomeroyi]|uniref:AMP-binding enzyme n=2 Tax=Ruegeria pomeroyi TaxID=89184 RepID=Q5LUN9_RUEPO|nr:AMP-binding protein [Ruegeria pomeroyi]AAV94318.1 AMP-binding enzyme [Ruegeria pomeroyi DSS-3]NVK97535.1 AMP-binding protein [Ruegeria pomeroyi]NVL01549.1 AMP-binding protein [Ruegeria pomeroyi]QWV07890.1 AMP-binding protein [Ruegeria pomeroyi]
MNIGLWLARQAQAGGERPALFLGRDLVADYAAFHDRAARVAGWLGSQGVAPGDRVALFMGNSPDYLILQYGIWYAGAAAVPINAKLHGREAAFILADSETTITFAAPDLAAALHAAQAPGRIVETGTAGLAAILAADPVAAPAQCDPGDLAWLFYTSGTTGRPKGVMITHRMLMAVSLAYPVDVDPVTPEDTVLYAAPMSHGAGLYNMVHVLRGARHVCPASGGFEPGEIFGLARHFTRVQMFAAPTMVKRMTDQARASGETGEGLRTVVYAGGPMYLADIVEAVEHFGPIFVQIYGQGECPMGITALSRHDVTDRSHPRWQERLASVGRAQSPVELRIGDGDGAPLPPGQTGEVMVRGDVVMPGYWRNPQASARALRDGWLMTGDMGFLDAEGYLTLQDRSKDLIISGGSNIYPREVEEVLLTHPLVREASVVGRPHPDWGEEVVAFVVGEATAAELDALCTRNIARFKRPKHYRWLPELPKNNYGKVLKTELRRILEGEG